MSYKPGTVLIRRKITSGGAVVPIGGVVKVITLSTLNSTGYEVEVVRDCNLQNGAHAYVYLYDDFTPLNLILKRKTL